MRPFAAAVLLFLAALPVWAGAAPEPRPRNIILFIGDGMGFGQVALGAVRAAAAVPAPADAPLPALLTFERFPVAGTLSNPSANSYVTDSAAAATALACGTKTNNGMVGIAPDGKRLESVAELAKRHGMAVGIVSSVGFDHATPAGFYAHEGSRDSYDAILAQALNCGTFDLLFGGGVFGKPAGGATLRAAAEAVGMAYFDAATFKELSSAATAGKPVLGMFDTNGNRCLDKDIEPRLAELTAQAVGILLARDTGHGFFLMVEGGAIDWACHGNNADNATHEVQEFDQAVAAALRQLAAAKRLDDTLVVVTADHETGGLVMAGPYGKPLAQGQTPELKWNGDHHSAMFVPLYATGPCAGRLANRHDNAELARILKALVAP